MATWTEVGLRLNPDDPAQGLLGDTAILGNPWMEEWLQARGADNLLKRNFPDAVPEQPEILKGATGLFDSLGKKPKAIFGGDSEGGSPVGDPTPVDLSGLTLGGRSLSSLGASLASPINAAHTVGALGGLFGPIGGVIGTGLGALAGSYAVDDLISNTTGYNPDVSAWDQFISGMTFGQFGKSGDQQMQEEFDAFSGMDNMFGGDDAKDPTKAFEMSDLEQMQKEALERAADPFSEYAQEDTYQEAIQSYQDQVAEANQDDQMGPGDEGPGQDALGGIT
tara:strand:- start:511 stop:1347 length:837 start_codon:yes stop_codon:yes gene_type:complete